MKKSSNLSAHVLRQSFPYLTRQKKSSYLIILPPPLPQKKSHMPIFVPIFELLTSIFYCLLTDQVDVNGANAAPIYKFLKANKGGLFGDGIKWNFSKFLVDKEGRVVDRYAPTTSPLSIEVKSTCMTNRTFPTLAGIHILQYLTIFSFLISCRRISRNCLESLRESVE